MVQTDVTGFGMYSSYPFQWYTLVTLPVGARTIKNDGILHYIKVYKVSTKIIIIYGANTYNPLGRYQIYI